jgi:hypothetical protein
MDLVWELPVTCKVLGFSEEYDDKIPNMQRKRCVLESVCVWRKAV